MKSFGDPESARARDRADEHEPTAAGGRPVPDAYQRSAGGTVDSKPAGLKPAAAESSPVRAVGRASVGSASVSSASVSSASVASASVGLSAAEIDRIYRQDRHRLLAYARRLAASCRLPDPRRDAEDVVQSAFEQALMETAAIASPTRWLFAVVRNKVYRAVRELREHAVEGEELDGTVAERWTSLARRPDPDDVLLARRVIEKIGELGSDRQRISTYLRHVEGWTPEEVAELLDIAPGTVWAHTSQGVSAVEKKMRRDPFYPRPGRAAVRPGDGAIGQGPGRRRYKASRKRRWTSLLTSSIAVLVILLGEGVVAGTFFTHPADRPRRVAELHSLLTAVAHPLAWIGAAVALVSVVVAAGRPLWRSRQTRRARHQRQRRESELASKTERLDGRQRT